MVKIKKNPIKMDGGTIIFGNTHLNQDLYSAIETTVKANFKLDIFLL